MKVVDLLIYRNDYFSSNFTFFLAVAGPERFTLPNCSTQIFVEETAIVFSKTFDGTFQAFFPATNFLNDLSSFLAS